MGDMPVLRVYMYMGDMPVLGSRCIRDMPVLEVYMYQRHASRRGLDVSETCQS